MKQFKKVLLVLISILIIISLASCTPIARGKSAYEIALDNGFVGTEAEWLASLKGANGLDGKNGQDGVNFNQGYTVVDLYNEMVANGGFNGTIDEFIEKYFAPTLSKDDDSKLVNKLMLSTCSIVCEFTESGKTSYSAGAGVFYSVDKENGDALILTNFHVVYNESSSTNNPISSNIHIFTYGSESLSSPYALEGKYEGGTTTYDLALLSVTGSDIIKNSLIESVSIADSNQISLGEDVFALGNPNGQGLSASKGVISVVSEYIDLTNVYGQTNNMRVIRFDAAVSPGNSGGGLYNSDGQLVGIVNAKNVLSDVDNMNYAIPSNVIKSIAKQLVNQCFGLSNTQIKKPLLGITVREENSTAIYDSTTGKVSVVAQIIIDSIDNTSIVRTKLKAGDRIISVKYNDQTCEITRNYMIIDIVAGCFKDDQLTFTIVRDGVTLTKTVTITSSCFSSVV